MDNKELVILAGKPAGGGAVSSVNGQTGAVVLTYESVGAAKAETVVTVSGATPSIEPVADKRIYKCGTLTSLTITNPPATGEYSIEFTSGATPTVCAFDDIRWPNNEAPTIEANTEYEIIVKDNRGICSQPGWPVEVNTP